jgi:hypothetical protein
MAGHQGVYARLRRALPGHDGVLDQPPLSFAPFSAFKASGCGIAITL